ncbi:MAG TPA: EamA family transporter [Candidatus Limnocylindria bacterium]|nr:EamA family transporter [Candidatus Limnocylindria bacterium]
MDPVALGALLALASAGLHAAWNLRLKASVDPLRTAAQAIPLVTLLATPAVALAWWLNGRPLLPLEGWLLALGSGAVELVYFTLLSRAYQRGEISSIYPIARGTAPLLAVVVGVALLAERLLALQWLGVAALIVGVWLTRPVSGGRGGLLLPLAIGASIALYSALDRLGVRTGPVWLYAWAAFAAMSLCLAPFGRAPRVPGAAAVGTLTVAAYSLVLLALSIAPLAVVAPAREAGVVVVAGWGVFRLGETERAMQKLVGAVFVVAGAFLLIA